MTLLDARPPAVDLFYRSGNTVTVTITWPVDYLDGRTYTAAIGADPIDVVIAGDVMTLTLDTPTDETDFVLTDTTNDDTEVLIGKWVASTRASAQSLHTVTVDPGDITVEVSLVESGANAAVQALGTRVTAAEGDITALEGTSASHTSQISGLDGRVDSLERQHIENLSIPKVWGRYWDAALDEADTRVVVLDVWGDSISDGVGASDWLTTSYVGRVIADLQATYGNGGSGYIPLNRATKTGTWTNTHGYLGNIGVATGTATATFSNISGTEIAIPYQNASITGSFRYRIDGGSWTTVTTPAGLGVDPVMVHVTGLSDTTHSVEIERLSGTVRIPGIEARRSTGVIARRFTISGKAATEFSSCRLDNRVITWTNGSNTISCASSARGFTASDISTYLAHLDSSSGLPNGVQITGVASPTSATLSMQATASGASKPVALHLNDPSYVEVLFQGPLSSRTANGFGQQGLGTPDCVIIGLGVNDMAAVTPNATPERFVDGVSTILDTYEDKGSLSDTLFLVNAKGIHGDRERAYPAIVAQTYALALAHDAAVVDMFGYTRRSYTYAESTWDYFADSIHPTDTGHQMIADQILQVLDP